MFLTMCALQERDRGQREPHMGDMKTRQCNFIFTHMLVIAFILPTYAFKYSWTSSCYVFCRFPQLMVVPPQYQKYDYYYPIYYTPQWLFFIRFYGAFTTNSFNVVRKDVTAFQVMLHNFSTYLNHSQSVIFERIYAILSAPHSLLKTKTFSTWSSEDAQ